MREFPTIQRVCTEFKGRGRNKDVGLVLLNPRVHVGTGEFLAEIHFCFERAFTARADIEPQPGIGLAALGDDEHDCPIAYAEGSGKSILVGAAWGSGTA